MGLDAVEFVLQSEKAFGLELPDEEVGSVSTVGEFADLIHQKLLDKFGVDNSPNSEAVFEKVKALLIEKQSVPERIIFRHSRFVQDLHLD
jgi:acyl carrier protein